MGGGKAKGGGGFSDADQLRMQQEMINQQIRAEQQAKDRPAVEAASKMPPVTPLNLGEVSVPKLANVPGVTGVAGIPDVKSVDWTALPLHDIPALAASLRSINDAPGVSKTKKAPGVKAMPKLFDPSLMPTRNTASLLAAKKDAVKSAAKRQGRASTILTR